MTKLKPEFNDKNKIKKFIQETFYYLKKLALSSGDEERGVYFLKDLRKDIKEAWKEFEKDFKFEDVNDRIDKTQYERLKKAGLYGLQLDLKLKVLDKIKNMKWPKSISRRLFKKLIDIIDHILESVIEATGLGSALKELKDIMSDAVDDQEAEDEDNQI